MNKIPIIMFSIMWLTLFSMLMFMYRNSYKPMIVMLALIMYTLLMCLFIVLWTWESMYSIIIFLILISGMFTMFMYFTSLINNQQPQTNTPLIVYLSFAINIIIFLMLLLSTYMIHHTIIKTTKNTPIHDIEIQTSKDSKTFTLLEEESPLVPNFLLKKQLSYSSIMPQSTETISTPSPSSPSDYSSTITMMYYNPWSYFTIMCILLLLVTLFMTIKICTIQNKSMRKMNK